MKLNSKKYFSIASVFLVLYIISSVLNWSDNLRYLFILCFAIPVFIGWKRQKEERANNGDEENKKNM